MIVDPDVLRRVRKGNRKAVIDVLAAEYPDCFRIACAINGRDDVGARIAALVLRQSFGVQGRWRDPDEPQRWFRHHTLLIARIAARWKPEPDRDTLARREWAADPAYTAFVRALRALPQQQVEAFILSHCEKLSLRSIATAMDCSTTAAQMHLRAADERLADLVVERFVPLVNRLREAYQLLTPQEQVVLSLVDQSVRQNLWRRRVLRWIRRIIPLGILAIVVWVCWRFRAQIDSLIRSILSRVGVA
jgi:DNA-directed RNA polymerase specialized sigma24 family protein